MRVVQDLRPRPHLVGREIKLGWVTGKNRCTPTLPGKYRSEADHDVVMPWPVPNSLDYPDLTER